MKPGRVLLLMAALGATAGPLLSMAGGQPWEEQTESSQPAVAMGAVASEVEPAALEQIPHYPESNPRQLSRQMQGEQLNAAWFATAASAAEVIAFYEKQFAAQGKWWLSHRFNEHAGYVGWLDADTRQLHLVSVMASGGESYVFPSTSFPEKYSRGETWPEGMARAGHTPSVAKETCAQRCQSLASMTARVCGERQAKMFGQDGEAQCKRLTSQARAACHRQCKDAR